MRTAPFPASTALLRAVLRDRPLEESSLVLRRTPPALDEERDAVVRGIAPSLVQGAEEGRIELGHSRHRAVEDRGAVGHGAVGLAEPLGGRAVRDGTARRAAVLAARDAALTVRDVDGRQGRRGRGRQRMVAEGCRDGDHDEDAGDTPPAGRRAMDRPSCRAAGAHAASQGSVALPACMRFSIRRRYGPARSIGACVC